jgi:DNA-binding IclR family transcriptional regulator
VYVESYVINGVGRPTPMYRAGTRQDATYLYETVIQSRHEKLLSRVVAELEQSPHTNRELSELMGLSLSGVRNLVNELRAMGWCRIGGWTPAVKSNSAPIFALGFHADAKQKAKTRAQRWKEEVADKDRHQRMLAKRRTRQLIKKVRVQPRTWLSALMQ